MGVGCAAKAGSGVSHPTQNSAAPRPEANFSSARWALFSHIRKRECVGWPDFGENLGIESKRGRLRRQLEYHAVI